MTEEYYSQLVAERKACTVCSLHLCNPSKISHGRYDSDRLGPYSRWQGKLNARLVVVAQDFASASKFEEVQGWPGPSISTNRNLVFLFREAGLPLRLPDETNHDVHFFTNSVLCMKRGAMTDPLDPSDVQACATRFLRPTLQLVEPKVVVALGGPALLGLSYAFSLGYTGEPIGNLIASETSYPLPWGGRAFPAYHTRGFPRGKRFNVQNWQRIATALHAA